jgi:apolipoprotein N-acyltransferase
MKILFPYLIAIFSGILLTIAWPPQPLLFLIFIALIPFIYVWHTAQKIVPLFFQLFFGMLAFNIGVTYWLVYSTVSGGLSAWILNSIFMTMPWLWSFAIKKKYGNWIGTIALIVGWLAFEWLHLNWEISWPWLTLGNIFAGNVAWIQWYEYTGVAGGSLWIWLVNILLFQLFFKSANLQSKNKILLAIGSLMVAFFPIYLSGGLYKKDTLNGNKKNIVVVQPNVDPYEEKFDEKLFQYELQKLINITNETIDENTSLVLWPETAVPIFVDENNPAANRQYDTVHNFLSQHPNINLLTGINSFKYLRADEKHESFTNLNKSNNTYYNEFNTAAFMDTGRKMQLYHKSKLVPGVEQMPYIGVFSFLQNFIIDLGGGGMYGTQKNRAAFASKDGTYKVAPVICYESIYGAFVTDYIKEGANIIGIVTNDAWWGNTAGYKQHLLYAKLRSIETRCAIARSANTGISCFIDANGTIYQPTDYNTKGAKKMALPLNNEHTFYVQHGDYIFNAAVYLFIFMFVLNILMKINFIKKSLLKK